MPAKKVALSIGDYFSLGLTVLQTCESHIPPRVVSLETPLSNNTPLHMKSLRHYNRRHHRAP